MEKSSFALTIMPRMPRPWTKMMLLTIAAAKSRTARSLPGRPAVRRSTTTVSQPTAVAANTKPMM